MSAFTAGVSLGGLNTSREIKILICYILLGVDGSLSADDVRDVLVGNEIANMFEVMDSIQDLIKNGSITEQADKTLSLTDDGKKAANQLVDMVPIALRDRALKAAMQLAARARFEKESDVQIKEIENGYVITCIMNKQEPDMMSFSLQVSDQLQVEKVRNKFLSGPSLFYKTLIALSTTDIEEKDGSLQVPLF